MLVAIRWPEEAQVMHLLGKVAAVELCAQDNLVEGLQLAHGELIGQQLECNGPEVDEFAQAPHSHRDDVGVVKRQFGQLAS